MDISDLEGLIFDMDELANIPDTVLEEMLLAGGEVIVKEQRASIRKHKLYKSGLLESSIQIGKKVKTKSSAYGLERYVDIYPQGRHHTYRRRIITRTYKRSKSGRTYSFGGNVVPVMTSEIAFIHEFGAPRRNIKASEWMRKANEAATVEAINAAEKVYDNFLRSKKL